ncbi:hypothetical protein IWW45_002554 [Coemansia sp. RSA 485]|nr:hypothetical protein IWW45_002554 [Coemansia sp. RSA 485]
MDLNLVCGPAALAEKQQQQAQMSAVDLVGPETPTAPLPSVHELENIRVSLREDDSIHAEVPPPSMAHVMSFSAHGASKLTAAASMVTPPNSALYRHSDTQLPSDAGGQHPVIATPAHMVVDARQSYAEQRVHTADTRVHPKDTASGADTDADCSTKGSKHASASGCDEKRRSSILEKYHSELRDVAEKCKILSQFSEQYGPEKNKFNAQPSDDLVIDMARKAYEVLMVFMTIRRERMSTSADDDTMEYIRKRRTVLSTTRTKTRKRSKRSDAAQPNTCRSCGISETPEWRRGPDGARTLCNACGLHYAKLNKKRATEANTHPGAESDAGSQTNSVAGAPLAAHTPGGSNPAAVSAHPQVQYPAQTLPQQPAHPQFAHHPHPNLHAHAQAHTLSHHPQQQQNMLPAAHPSHATQQEYVSPHSHVHAGASSSGLTQHVSQPMHSAPWPQTTYYQQQQQQQSAYQYQNAPAHCQHGAGGYMQHSHQAQPPPYHHQHSAPSYASTTPRSDSSSLAPPAAVSAPSSAPTQHPAQQSPPQPQPRPVKASISRILG